MIRIIYGKAKSGKTERIYKEILERINADKSEIFLIVPEQFTLEAEKQLIEFGELEGFIGIEVVSFKRLAYRIFSEVGQPEGAQITEVGQLMLLRKLFADSKSKLNVYQSAYDKAGFLTKVNDLIKEFKQTMISPLDLDALIDQFSDQALLRSKLSDLNTIYKAYEAEKEKKYFDDEDTYDYLLHALSISKNIKDAHVWIDGFDSYTKQELEIISVIMSLAKETTISICSDGKLSEGVFEHTNTFFNKFVNIAKDSNLKIKMVACETDYSSEDVRHIAENLSMYPYSKKEVKADDIRIFAADSRINEVEFCAASMLEFVRENAYTWQDFAVVTNDLDAYEMSIKCIFDELEIPYFLDKKVSAYINPLVRLVLAYLKMIKSGYAAEHVMNFLKSGFFDFDDIALYGFENYIRQYGISESKLKVKFENEVKYGFCLDQVNAVRERLLCYMNDLNQSKAPLKKVIEAIYNMLVLTDAYGIINKKVDCFIEASQFDSAQYNTQIWNLTMDLFDQAVNLLGEDVFSLDDVIHILEAGFETLEVGLLPLVENHVLVGSVDRSRAHPIKVLFFLGFNDGIIPEIGQDKQLILDSEKAVFKAHGIDFVADQTMFANKEQFNIYFALSRPSEKLYFSYARSDSEGGALRPSYYIPKLLKICRNLKVDDERTHDFANSYRISNAKGTLKHLALEMRRSVDGYPISDDWHRVFEWYAKHCPEKASMLLNGLTHSNRVNHLEERFSKAAFSTPIHTNVSELEQYVQCPFKYFVASGLKPIPQKQYDLGAPDIGTLFHKALEIFGKSIYENQLSWESISKEESDQMIDTIVDEMTMFDVFQSKHQYRYLINKLKRVSKKAAWVLTEHLKNGLFEPVAFEVAFGRESESAPPIFIELSNGESMMIRGVIDRIDKVTIDDQTYIKIIDYKSGKKQLTMSDIYNGLQMQLMVYLSACLENPEYLKVDKVLPAGAFYFKIDDPIIESTAQFAEIIEKQIASELKLDGLALEDETVLKHIDRLIFENNASEVIEVRVKNDGAFTKDSKILSLDAFEGLMKHVKQTIQKIGNELQEGNIEILPCKSKEFVSCQYCDFKAICQFDPHFEGNRYRHLKSYSNEEVLEKVGEKPHGEMDI